MSKALIVYGSTTGNTEMVAKQIGDILLNKGHDVTVKDVAESKVDELGNGYDITILGSSTWGEDEIEFQEDFEPFYEEMNQKGDLKGKKVALFGCGDTSYEYFCGAVDKLEELMVTLGADVVAMALRIDGDPDDSGREIEEWADEVASVF